MAGRYPIWLIVICALLPAIAVAGPYDPPPTYYNSATGTGATLKSQLSSIMASGHIQRTYGDFRFSAAVTDADPNVPGNILLVYDRASVSGVWNLGGQLPWNREHVWPQTLQPGSASNGTKGNLGDPHALRPADTDINSDRGHKAFGFENTTGSYGVLSNDYFFPGDADRGDVARQLFYSATRYLSLGLSFTEGVPSGNQMGDFSSLLAWHYLDTPDEFELRRNHAIYSSALNPSYFTNNRNAYIDRPEYVWSVYVDQQNDSQIAISGATVGGDGSTGATVDLGRVLVGAATPAAQTVTINKNGSDGTYFEVSTSGDATSSLSGRYHAFRTGGTDSTTIDVGLNASTATAGPRSGAVTIDNLDVTTAGGAGRGANDADDVLNVNLDVVDHANASFASAGDTNTLTHDFGMVTEGVAMPTFDFDIFNLVDTAGFTADLELDSFSGVGDTGVLTTDLAPLLGGSALEAGLGTMFTATLDTSTIGIFSATYTLNFSDEDLPGAISLGDLSLTLLGTVAAAASGTADFDEDGDIDGADFLAWQGGFGFGTTLGEGDSNGDNVVNGADLLVWNHQFAAPPPGSLVSVPEPAGALLLLYTLGAFALLRGRSFRSAVP